ncbi:PD-(D/E)XK nuclease family protein [Halalkalibacter krulwichiae]|uniref:ATP-dependent helicase/deoxyribonuclease subunit B n=1 Tax=Halalkalibacter krulwichiae TaxID=199441 RepID=A0A1X9ML87_9BACI|nr:PD-(D/E)XK nuclease family protein [Halalkalibacter krulwichiae]ARK31542.1 ATP-dependent helicase/deoxyribonuclease subunit B [Halalkalibacter krulwichiae]
MSKHVIYGTHVTKVANQTRLKETFSIQKEEKKTAFYVLPSHMWLQEARRKQPSLPFTTFDDIASYILQQANVSYIPLTEEERTLFFLQFIREDEMLRDDLVVSGKARAYADTYGQIKRLGLEVDHSPLSLQPLVSLFKSYEKETIHNRNLLDPENILLRAIRVLLDEPSQVEISLVVVDGYYDFSPLQALFIEALKKAGVAVNVYIPHHPALELVDKTVSELIKMGFEDERGSLEEVEVMVENELVAASTEEEQWRGILEEISLSYKNYEEAGILVVDESKGMEQLERFAKMYEVPINKARKRKVSTTTIHSFIVAILERDGRPKSKWEQLPLIELILRLYQVSGLDFAKQKQAFLQTGEWYDEKIQAFYEQVSQVRWKQQNSFVEYLKEIRELLEKWTFETNWINSMKVEEDVSKLRELADEHKAFTELKNELQTYEQLLREKGLGSLMMTHDLLVEWVENLGEKLHLFEARGSKKGLAVHTWRDVGLFKGKKLYVVGMNEGVFPAVHRLSGYVQERDLTEGLVRYSPPTQEHFRLKQQAHFAQLPYVAESVTYTYVKGIDVNHPKLPSPLLEQVGKADKVWTLEKRIEAKVAYSTTDQIEKISYHVGKGCLVEEQPETIEHLLHRIKRIEEAEEPISLYNDKPLQPVVSVTALESYARCPFKYGMERILQVDEPQALQEKVSPIDIGHLMHSIIEQLYIETSAIGRSFIEAREDILKIPERLEGLFEEKWEQIENQSLEISRFDLELTKAEWKKRLLRWWIAERKHFWDNDHLQKMEMMALEKPIRFEIQLSNGQKLVLTGKADRVDRLDDSIVIYDYKSGQASVKMEDVKAGLKLQLPLYAYAIREEIERIEEATVKADGATYISLKEPNKRAGNGIWRSEHVGKESRYKVSSHCRNREDELGTEQFLISHNLIERIEELWRGMHSNFPVAPLECSQFCQYRSICRVTDEKREQANG